MNLDDINIEAWVPIFLAKTKGNILVISHVHNKHASFCFASDPRENQPDNLSCLPN